MDPAEMLARGFTRETTITRNAAGQWFQGGQALEHAGVSASFDGWIDRAPDGRFCLINNINWAFVQIEGPPYFVRSAQLGEGAVTLHLSGGHVEPLDATTLRIDVQGALWCDVRDGRVPARFDNHAACQLEPLMVADDNDHGVAFAIGEDRYVPRMVDDPMAGWTPERGHVESHR